MLNVTIRNAIGDKQAERLGVSSDEPRIRELHAQLERKLGRGMDLPAVEDPAILRFMVAERDGLVIGFHYQEKAIEMCHGGLDPEGTAAFREHQDQMFRAAKELGVRFIHCQVPKKCTKVGKHLQDSNFENVSDKYDHYVLDLR